MEEKTSSRRKDVEEENVDESGSSMDEHDDHLSGDEDDGSNDEGEMVCE